MTFVVGGVLVVVFVDVVVVVCVRERVCVSYSPSLPFPRVATMRKKSKKKNNNKKPQTKQRKQQPASEVRRLAAWRHGLARCTCLPVPRHLCGAPCCSEPKKATRPSCMLLTRSQGASAWPPQQNRTVPRRLHLADEDQRLPFVPLAASACDSSPGSPRPRRRGVGESQGCSGCPCKRGARQD